MPALGSCVEGVRIRAVDALTGRCEKATTDDVHAPPPVYCCRVLPARAGGGLGVGNRPPDERVDVQREHVELVRVRLRVTPTVDVHVAVEDDRRVPKRAPRQRESGALGRRRSQTANDGASVWAKGMVSRCGCRCPLFFLLLGGARELSPRRHWQRGGDIPHAVAPAARRTEPEPVLRRIRWQRPQREEAHRV